MTIFSHAICNMLLFASLLMTDLLTLSLVYAYIIVRKLHEAYRRSSHMIPVVFYVPFGGFDKNAFAILEVKPSNAPISSYKGCVALDLSGDDRDQGLH